jgi:Calcineurin-like phosphoesterase
MRLRKRLATVSAIAVITAVGVVAVGAPAHAATLTFIASADTYVQDSTPFTNYGTSTQIVVDNSPVRRTFIRFTVSGLSGTVTSAKLRVRTINSNAGSDRGGTFRSMTNSWSETGTTWYNQPAINGATHGTLGSVTAGTWYEINVTAAVTTNGTYSFGATSASGDGAYYSSRESGTYAPQLVITTDPAIGDPVLVGAGDIADCSSTGDEATANLLDSIAGTVFTAGDNAYDSGTTAEFDNCYHPSWGRHKARTRPSAGNHEYVNAGAAGYFGYFGAAAGDPSTGYYSYDLGTWHVAVINSNCSAIGGCGVDSPQERWLRADLAASSKSCTIAYWHHPLFTSGANHGPATEMRPIFQVLYDFNAEVVVVGHNHQYERFAPQNPGGGLDNARGLRQFVAGTGGRSHHGFGTIQPNSEARNSDTYGVLKLTLRANGYDWRFVPEAGKSFTDGGSGSCH